MICLNTITLLTSSLCGRVEHLNANITSAILVSIEVALDLLNLLLQSAVGIFGSLRPGVSMRL